MICSTAFFTSLGSQHHSVVIVEMISNVSAARVYMNIVKQVSAPELHFSACSLQGTLSSSHNITLIVCRKTVHPNVALSPVVH